MGVARLECHQPLEFAHRLLGEHPAEEGAPRCEWRLAVTRVALRQQDAHGRDGVLKLMHEPALAHAALALEHDARGLTVLHQPAVRADERFHLPLPPEGGALEAQGLAHQRSAYPTLEPVASSGLGRGGHEREVDGDRLRLALDLHRRQALEGASLGRQCARARLVRVVVDDHPARRP